VLVRQRFSIAHELGHYLCGHEDFPAEGRKEKIRVDGQSDFGDRQERLEMEATEFAAELLMPLLRQEGYDVSSQKLSPPPPLCRSTTRAFPQMVPHSCRYQALEFTARAPSNVLLSALGLRWSTKEVDGYFVAFLVCVRRARRTQMAACERSLGASFRHGHSGVTTLLSWTSLRSTAVQPCPSVEPVH
jgi:hypothetical protein